MTDEELDLLASAYVDGEATPEEVALVEADPELVARVESFAAVRVGQPTPAPSDLAQAHLAAAMAEFGVAAEVPPVVDLQDRARQSNARRTKTTNRRSRLRSTPSWLPAAAAVVIIGGGVVWAAGQQGADSSDETAASLTETAEDGVEARQAADDLAIDNAESDPIEPEAAMDEAAGSAPAPAADDSAGDDAGGDGEADENAEEDAEEEGDSFIGLDPLMVIDQVPSDEKLADLALPEPETDLTLARCSGRVVSPAFGEPTGFVPIEVEGEPAELFLFTEDDGTETRVLVDEFCGVIELSP